MSDYCIENDLPRQQELEAIRQTKLMRDASYLLPDPGGDVVRQLLNEIDSLKHWLKHYQARTGDAETLVLHKDAAIKILTEQLATARREGWEQCKEGAYYLIRQYNSSTKSGEDEVNELAIAIAAMEYEEIKAEVLNENTCND